MKYLLLELEDDLDLVLIREEDIKTVVFNWGCDDFGSSVNFPKIILKCGKELEINELCGMYESISDAMRGQLDVAKIKMMDAYSITKPCLQYGIEC